MNFRWLLSLFGIGVLVVFGQTAYHSATYVRQPVPVVPTTVQTPHVAHGVPNPDITQATIWTTICNPNWSTSSIRPPTSYTSPLKLQFCKQQNCGDPSKYELNHKIALVDGGDPTDPDNLELVAYEPRPGAHEQDRLEVAINKKICHGDLTLKQGQDILTGDWLKTYNEWFPTKFGGVADTPDVVDPDDL